MLRYPGDAIRPGNNNELFYHSPSEKTIYNILFLDNREKWCYHAPIIS